MNEVINLSNMDYQKYIDIAIEWAISYWPKILWALLVLWIGFKIVKMIDKTLIRIMDKAELDPMLESFISSLLIIILKVLVVISAAWIVWVQTTSFVAMLAAAWLAIGMALSGTLQNFAWGVMILFLKPYSIWDYIEAAWYWWTVKEIHIFNTVLVTPDKKIIIIPNSELSNASMTNYSVEPIRRLDLQVWVSYNDDIDLVKQTLEEIAKKDNRVLVDEWLTIVLNELWDNAVIFNFRVFCKSWDYWALKWDLLENIKKTFDKKGISFPFPQRDVYVYNK